MAKTYEEKQRDKRIQKQTEKLGGPKVKPKPRTLKQAAQRELKRAVLSTKGDGSLKAAGFRPRTGKELRDAYMIGYRGLYNKAVPKELRDRLKFEMNNEKTSKKKKK